MEMSEIAHPLDLILNRIEMRESSGDPSARGKKGEIGLFQIRPETARQYGVSPKLLASPVINRWVARRYLGDLLKRFHGNVFSAVEAYNAGPSRVSKGDTPATSIGYAKKILEGIGSGVSHLLGEGTAEGGEIPPPPPGFKLDLPTTTSARPPGFTLDKSAKKGEAKATEPLPVRAASWLPTAGQYVGETLGALGGAAIPLAGESGIPEYAGAVSGGTAGSAAGAAGENLIRKAYGLPPVSVGKEAAYGGAGSAVGGAIPLVPRMRKAAAIARATGKSFSEALEEVTQQTAKLEGLLGMGERKAALLKNAPATQVQQAYQATKEQGFRELSEEYDTILRGFRHTPIRTSNGLNALQGIAGRKLELVGKPLRQSLQEEIAREPLTVGRIQQIISHIRQLKRSVPENRVALSALDDIEKALAADRNQIIGPARAAALKNVDVYYARQIQRFPNPQVRGAFTEPQAAEAILGRKSAPEIIGEFERTGRLPLLRRATAARIFEKAELSKAVSPIERFDRLEKAVESVKADVFDALYGKGAQREWLSTARTLSKTQRDLLKNPTRAAAIGSEVEKFLTAPGAAERLVPFLKHHALWAAIGGSLIVSGRESNNHILVMAGTGLLGVSAYEAVAHSRIAMNLLRAAATQRNPAVAARMIVAALSTAARTEGESVLENTGTEGP